MASTVTTTGLLGESSSSQLSANSAKSGLSTNQSVIASLLEQSSRHLFGPTSQPTVPPKQQVVSITGLTKKLHYLKPEEINQIKRARGKFSPVGVDSALAYSRFDAVVRGLDQSVNVRGLEYDG